MGCLSRLILIGLGWAFGGPIGGIIGYALGGLFSGRSPFVMRSEVNEHFGNTSEQRDFNVSLLVLSAAVMKADWQVKKARLSPFSLWDLAGKALLTPVRKEVEWQFKCFIEWKYQKYIGYRELHRQNKKGK